MKNVIIILVIFMSGCVSGATRDALETSRQWYKNEGYKLVEDATKRALDESKHWWAENGAELTKTLLDKGIVGLQEKADEEAKKIEVTKKMELDFALKPLGKNWHDFDANDDNTLDIKELMEIDKFFTVETSKQIISSITQTIAIEAAKSVINGENVTDTIKTATTNSVKKELDDRGLKETIKTIFGATGVLALIFLLNKKSNSPSSNGNGANV